MVEPDVPKVPMDYTWAKRLGLVRKPANFISSISDDRGDELRSVLCTGKGTHAVVEVEVEVDVGSLGMLRRLKPSQSQL